VNPFLARAIAVQRKIEDGSSLDQFDAEIVDFALRRLIREGRVPFQRFRDHSILSRNGVSGKPGAVQSSVCIEFFNSVGRSPIFIS
jgi:hypothetical protein